MSCTRNAVSGFVCTTLFVLVSVCSGQTVLPNGQELLSSVPTGGSETYLISIAAPGTMRVSVGETTAGLPAEPALQIFDPSGNLIDSDFGGTSSSEALIQFSATTPGVYEAVVSERNNDEPLQFRIRALLVPGNPVLISGRDSNLQNGTEIEASIPLGTFAVYPFDIAVAGTVIVSAGETGTSMMAEPVIEVFDPSGNLVASDSGSTSSSDARVEFDASQAGTYTIVLADRNNEEIVEYRVRALSVSESPNLIGGRDLALSNGEEFNTSIPLGTFAVFPFEVTGTGTAVFAIGESGVGLPAEPALQIFDPAGIEVAMDFGSTGSSDAFAQFEATSTGTFIAVAGDRDNDESIDCLVRVLVLPGSPSLINGRDNQMDNGEEFLSSFPLGTFATFPVQVDAPGTVIVTVGETGAGLPAEPYLQVFDPSGVRVGFDFGSTASSDALVNFSTNDVGTFTAVVHDRDNDEPLDFRIRCLVLPGVPELIGSRDFVLDNGIPMASGVPLGTFAVFPVPVETDGNVRISVSETGAGLPAEPVIQFYDPQGALIDEDTGGTGSSVAAIDVAVSQAGTYFAVVQDRDNDEPLDFSITALFPQIVRPESVTPTRGLYVSGDGTDLSESDNNDYSMQRNGMDIQSRTEFVVKATSSLAIPNGIRVTLEGSVFGRTTIEQFIEVFNYDAQQWELVDQRNARRLIDSSATIVLNGDVSRFVEPGTNCMEVRVRYRSLNQRQQFSSNTDQVVWVIE